MQSQIFVMPRREAKLTLLGRLCSSTESEMREKKMAEKIN
jgi:hypothetical protein